MKLNLFILTLAIGFSGFAKAEQESSRARYSVPVKNERLKKFADFQIEKVEETKEGNQTEIRYILPLELTGVPNEVTFRTLEAEESALTTLSGPNGSMMCSEGLTKLCTVQFKNLKIDEAARLDILQSKSSSARELRGRLSVAKSFSGDPGGVLSYESYK